MIRSFADKETERLFNDEDVPRFRSIQNPARRRLMLIHRAATLHDLAGPGLSLERMVKERRRRGQHAIRISGRYRICFTWVDGDAFDVEITDYH